MKINYNSTTLSSQKMLKMNGFKKLSYKGYLNLCKIIPNLKMENDYEIWVKSEPNKIPKMFFCLTERVSIFYNKPHDQDLESWVKFNKWQGLENALPFIMYSKLENKSVCQGRLYTLLFLMFCVKDAIIPNFNAKCFENKYGYLVNKYGLEY